MTLEAAYIAVRDAALRYPTAYEEAPWGERVVKVNKKIFLFAFRGEDRLGISLKLPSSKEEALKRSYASPMGYGMGKHGWVSFGFNSDDEVPVDALIEWMDESFRAVAPKKLLADIEAGKPMPKAPEPPSMEGVVVLVGEDALRLERSRAWLIQGGLTVETATLDEAVDVAGDAEPELVIVDVCRDANKAVALLPDIGLVCVDAQIIVAGVRDAKMERSLVSKLPDYARTSREAPGDPRVNKLVVEMLG